MTGNNSSLSFPANAVRKNFFLLEGLDGSGKSTQVKRISKFLSSINKKNFPCQEPTGFPSGIMIRKILTEKKSLSAQEELDLFMEDRVASVNKNILPALSRGEIVLLDRYIYSNAGYQGMNLGWENVLRQNIEKKFPIPERTYYLDLSPNECLKRLSKRGTQDTYFEKKEILTRIEKIYKSIVTWDPGFKIIRAGWSEDAVFEEIKEDILEIIAPL